MDCAADMDWLGLLSRAWMVQPRIGGRVTSMGAKMNARLGTPLAKRRPKLNATRALRRRTTPSCARCRSRACRTQGAPCLARPTVYYISKDLPSVNSGEKQDGGAKIQEALAVLQEVLQPTSEASHKAALQRLPKMLSGPTAMNGMVDILTDALSKYTRISSRGRSRSTTATSFGSSIAPPGRCGSSTTRPKRKLARRRARCR
jgi:hypothetical protein